MSTIKQNLDECYRKLANKSTPFAAQSNAQPKSSKFKPARSFDKHSNSNATVHGHVAAAASVNSLPSFSTPNFGKSTSSLPRQIAPLSVRREIIDVSSDESMLVDPGGPLKRTSSDNSFSDPPASTSKRVRKDGPCHEAIEDSVFNKENVQARMPKSKPQERRPPRPVGHDARFRPAQSQGTESSVNRATSLRETQVVPAWQPQSSESTTVPNLHDVSDVDLVSKTEKDLRKLLLFNQAKAFETAQSIESIENGQDDMSDIVTLRAIKRILTDRMESIQAAIRRLSGRISPSAFEKPSSDIPSSSNTHIDHSSSSKLSREPSPWSHHEPKPAVLAPPPISISLNTLVPSSSQITETAATSTTFNMDEDEAMWAELGDLPMHALEEESRPRSTSSQAIQMTPVVQRPAPRSVSDSAIVPLYDREPVIDSPYMEEVKEKLSSVFGMKDFRKNQLRAILATMDGRDVLVLMPTGGGKSLCYQLPAICQTGKTKGMTVVISPLLALMSDQVQGLMKRGIDVVCFSSDQSDEANSESWGKLYGPRKPSLMYVTPERLYASDKMRSALQRVHQAGQLARFVIDEAHVISSWGRNFRTAYKHLDRIRRDYPDVPIMALTATANKKTRRDITDRLGIQDCEVLMQSFNRPNLHYSVRPKCKSVINDIATFIKSEHLHETGIIYCTSRDKCEEVAKELRDKYNLRARHFHAKMDNEDKRRAQKGWQEGEFEIIVATIAFGMGIDKRDVRFVIHHSLSRSLDGYAQETGRAGRDGKPSNCLLYYSGRDVEGIMNQIRNDKELSPEDVQLQIDEVWQMAYFCTNDVDCRRVQLMSFFDQTFNPQDCHNSCNNCVDTKELKIENVTVHAVNAVKLLQSMLQREQRVAQAVCIATFRGSKSAAVTRQGFDSLPLYGSGQAMPAKQVQRLFTLLCSKGAFDLQPVFNGTWNNTYMKLGHNADIFLNGRLKEAVTMSVAVRTSSSTAQKPSRKKATRKARSTSAEGSNEANEEDPIQDYDYQQDLSIDDDDDDIIELAPVVPPSHSSSSGKSPEVDPLERCYKELCTIRERIALRENVELEDILHDECLQMLSCTSVRDLGDFRRVLYDAYGPDVAETKRKQYEQHFLNVCIKKTITDLDISTIVSTTDGPKAITFDANEMQSRYAYPSKPSSTRHRKLS